MSVTSKITDIADALRYTYGTTEKYTLSQMPGMIKQLSSNIGTEDIYHTLFEFNVSKYGESIISQQSTYSWSFPYDEEKHIWQNGKYAKYRIVDVDKDGNPIEYVNLGSNYCMQNLQILFPYGDYEDDCIHIIRDVNNNYVTPIAIVYGSDFKIIDNLRINGKCSFTYEKQDDVKTFAIALNLNKNANSRSLSQTSNYDKILHFTVENSILYFTIQSQKQQVADLTTLEGTEFTLAFDILYNELENNQKEVSYDIKVNGVMFTDLLSYNFTNTLFASSNCLGFQYTQNIVDNLRWFNYKIDFLRYKDVVKNPFVSYMQNTLVTLDDDVAPGLKNIAKESFAMQNFSNFEIINHTSVETIGDYAFSCNISGSFEEKFITNCLHSITLPSVADIGNYAFYNSTYINDTVSSSPYIDNYSNVVYLNIDKVESLGKNAFSNELTTIFKPLYLQYVKSIGSSCFSNNSFTMINLPNVENLGSYAFSNSRCLEEIDLESITKIGSNAFSSCPNLNVINLPNVETLEDSCFYNSGTYYTKEKNLNIPKLVSIGSSCFYNMNFGRNGVVEFNELQNVGNSCFYNVKCKTIKLPKLLKSSQSMFNSMKGVENIELPILQDFKDNYSTSDGLFNNLRYSNIRILDMDIVAPNLTKYEIGMFQYINTPIIKSTKLATPMKYVGSLCYNSDINQVYFENIPFIAKSSFTYCASLELAYFGSLYTIGNDNSNTSAEHFAYTPALQALILAGKESVCSLYATSNFNYSNIKSGDGYIYVPSELLEAYKTDSKWSTFADKIRAIEDYGGLEGIKKLIYGDFQNVLTLTNQEVYDRIVGDTILSDANNECFECTLGTFDVALQNEGDESEYICFRRLNTNQYSYRGNRFFLDFPKVKDFQLEFDLVFDYDSNCPYLEYGFEKLPTSEEELESLSSDKVYAIGLNYGIVYGKVNPCNIEKKSNGSHSSQLTSETSYNYQYYNSTSEFYWNNEDNRCKTGCYIEYSRCKQTVTFGNNTSCNWYGKKSHYKIIKLGRYLKVYQDERLIKWMKSDKIEQTEGYFAFSNTYTYSKRHYGVSNFMLKY